MPRGPKGERRPADVIGNAVHVMRTAAGEVEDSPFVAPNSFFTSRRLQFSALLARDRIPAAYSPRDTVATGGLMSYGTEDADMLHQVGV